MKRATNKLIGKAIELVREFQITGDASALGDLDMLIDEVVPQDRAYVESVICGKFNKDELEYLL